MPQLRLNWTVIGREFTNPWLALAFAMMTDDEHVEHGDVVAGRGFEGASFLTHQLDGFGAPGNRGVVITFAQREDEQLARLGRTNRRPTRHCRGDLAQLFGVRLGLLGCAIAKCAGAKEG